MEIIHIEIQRVSESTLPQRSFPILGYVFSQRDLIVTLQLPWKYAHAIWLDLSYYLCQNLLYNKILCQATVFVE